MPLFECSQCKAVENTALGDCWTRIAFEFKPPICSECSTGTWHGEFEKRTPVEAGLTEHDKQGHLYRPADLAPGGYFAKTVDRCTCSDVQTHYVARVERARDAREAP